MTEFLEIVVRVTLSEREVRQGIVTEARTQARAAMVEFGWDPEDLVTEVIRKDLTTVTIRVRPWW